MRASSSGFYNSSSSKLSLITTHTTDQQESEEVLISDQLVFKSAMTRDYRSIQELSIIQEGVTLIDNGNMALK